MGKIQNPMAYFTRMVQNMNKNEYRSNDTFYKHVSSVGTERDVHIEVSKQKHDLEMDSIEAEIMEYSFENWISLISNANLYNAITGLSKSNQMLLFMLYVRDLRQSDCAKIMGISQSAVGQRSVKIKNTIKKAMTAL